MRFACLNLWSPLPVLHGAAQGSNQLPSVDTSHPDVYSVLARDFICATPSPWLPIASIQRASSSELASISQQLSFSGTERYVAAQEGGAGRLLESCDTSLYGHVRST